MLLGEVVVEPETIGALINIVLLGSAIGINNFSFIRRPEIN